jgi:hypothetical protein
MDYRCRVCVAVTQKYPEADILLKDYNILFLIAIPINKFTDFGFLDV